VSLISPSSWGPSLFPTFSAIDRPVLVRFEWNFTFFSALSTDCLMHFPWFSSIRHLDYTSRSARRTSFRWNPNSRILNVEELPYKLMLEIISKISQKNPKQQSTSPQPRLLRKHFTEETVTSAFVMNHMTKSDIFTTS